MRREYRERFSCHQLQSKQHVSDPGMHHDTCVTHVPWCMSGSLTCGCGKTFPASRCMCNPQYHLSGKGPIVIIFFITPIVEKIRGCQYAWLWHCFKSLQVIKLTDRNMVMSVASRIDPPKYMTYKKYDKRLRKYKHEWQELAIYKESRLRL